MFFQLLKHFSFKDKFWLLCGSLADRIMMKVPDHIFITRNFLESLKTNKYLISGDNTTFEVNDKKGGKFILRKGSSDLMVFQQIMVHEEFKNVVDLIHKYEIKIKNILDAGSNIGLTTIYLKNYFKGAEVICVEPDETNLQQLQINLTNNNVKNVEIVKGGIWSNNGWLEMDYSFRDGREWSRRLKVTTEGSGSIPVYSINYLLNKSKWESIDLLKMDIEGAENVIFNDSEGLNFLEITKVLTIEVHDKYKMTNIILEKLIDFNFKVYFSGELMIGIKRG